MRSGAARVDDGTGDVLLFLRHNQVHSISLGLPHYPSLALTQAEIGLPDPEAFVQKTQDRGLPEMMSFVTACLGLMLAVYLVRTWKH